ncbi:DUF6182 family protein [Streptomyces sp. NPDC029554]|uniref:DUF6182 family protein n=1 Tax=Streptomyces sp. NPDC029554 TaxID=3155126 RepID=UPI0033E3F4B4
MSTERALRSPSADGPTTNAAGPSPTSARAGARYAAGPHGPPHAIGPHGAPHATDQYATGPYATGPLAAAARARLAAVRHGLGDTPVTPGLTVAVVVGELDLPAFVAGAARFALGLPPALADGWYRAFTRTVFLSGRPATLAPRHPHRYAGPTAGLAWYGPARRGALKPLSRLLRAFEGPAPVRTPDGALTVALPGPPSGHTAHAVLATGGTSTAAYLVHTHHLVAEAALRGLIRPGDTVRVTHRHALPPGDHRDALDPSRAGSVQTRIAACPTDPHRLRLYGVLTTDRPEGKH